MIEEDIRFILQEVQRLRVLVTEVHRKVIPETEDNTDQDTKADKLLDKGEEPRKFCKPLSKEWFNAVEDKVRKMED